MNGFTGPVSDGGSTPIDEAVAALVTSGARIDRTERVPIRTAAGRVLADAVRAERPQPHYRRSERDGYAIRATDTTDASPETPVELETKAEPVGPGEATWVHTGSAVPEIADAVVMVESVTETEDGIEITEPAAVGQYVTAIGADLEGGATLFEPGHRLRAGDLGTLKVAGIRSVPVIESPTVAVVPTGEELVQTDPGPGEVVETNGLVGSTLIRQWCGTARYREVVTDDEAALRNAIERDLDANLIVTTGGSSVGARDLLPAVVNEMGEVVVRGLALRPGHSASVGVVSGTPIAMLPGTPIAALVVAWVLVRPALGGLIGAAAIDVPTVQATLSADLESERGRRTVHGVTIDGSGANNSHTTAREAPRGGLPSLPGIDGWVQVEESRGVVAAGDIVTVERWGVESC
ncbi:MAG: molybdopterin molybdotransferase MoeA [Halodesulfurarchaeum sp.]|nr:molybdopterin molybdotransferase MoeA [Halodesulfurarchaeum sp.]